MTDRLNPDQRSALMSKVKSRGNLTTELRVLRVLRANDITGWRRHSKNTAGKPDFYFPAYRLAMFVHGCFWHGCEKCGRFSKSRVRYWSKKIEENRRRDTRVRRRLNRSGYRVLTIWEHDVRGERWLTRLESALRKPRLRNGKG